MTTAITLETSEGHLAFALALGILLIAVSIAISASAFVLEARPRRIAREKAIA